MGTISLTSPIAGTTITAGLHATNYTTIATVVNGNLDANNWATGKIFAPSKFLQEAAGRQDGMVWNGTIWIPTPVASVYDRSTAGTDVQNTAAMTSLYTKTITGNDMGTTKALRLVLQGDYLHNNVGADTLTLRVQFGGGTVYQGLVGSLGGTTTANRHPWECVLRLSNEGAANSQELSGYLDFMGTGDGAPTTGIGGFSGSALHGLFGSNGLLAIDTTANQVLDVAVQWSAASTNNSWRMRRADLEIL